MRLFSAGTFYLHQSSRVAAEWLCDRDTISQLRNTGNLLSSVIQMHTMEVDRRLYPVDRDVHVACTAVCDWLHASVFNYQWMVDYFDCLDNRCVKLFKHTPLTYDFKAALHSYTDVFDHADTTPGWLPLTTAEAREAYALEIKSYQYRRVKVPFWFDIAKPRKVSTGLGGGSDPSDYTLPASLLDLELDLAPIA